jgi:hypothetical protein
MSNIIEQVDWQRVVAEVVEHRAEVECRIQQRIAELRAANRPERLADKVELAAMQDNIAAADELLERILDQFD